MLEGVKRLGRICVSSPVVVHEQRADVTADIRVGAAGGASTYVVVRVLFVYAADMMVLLTQTPFWKISATSEPAL